MDDSIEKRAKRRRKKENIQKMVLATLAIAGVLTVTAVTPNIFQAFPNVMGRKRYKLAFQARTAIGRLLVKDHVRFVEKSGKRHIELTEKGWRVLELERARAAAPARRKTRWDRRYRIVMFDIPQKRTSTRNRLRNLMHEFGFLRLQDSVWVSPYDCEELIVLLKAELRVGKDVLYVLAEEIENDAWVKKHFGLA